MALNVPISISESEQTLLQRSQDELILKGDLEIPLALDIDSVVMLIANLKIAIQHPSNTGESARVARQFIDDMLALLKNEGYPDTAALAAIGYKPGPSNITQVALMIPGAAS